MENQDIADKLFARWGATSHQVFDITDVAKLLSISFGLGAIFNENAEAERTWMQTPHHALKTRPITAVLAGSLDEVLGVIEKERGL